MKTSELLHSSWLNGKYETGEINTSLPTIEIYDFWEEGSSYFAQGEDAQNTIDEINVIYNTGNLTVEQAIMEYKNVYGY